MGTIDFWTDNHRKKSFGTFVIDVVAEKYELCNGMSLFMSRHTKVSLSNCQKSPLLTGKPILANAEVVLNFEQRLESFFVLDYIRGSQQPKDVQVFLKTQQLQFRP